jgi:hypothetical protein
MATKYATPAELRARIGKTATADDDVLEAILEAASRNIDRACNRPDGFRATVAAARLFTGLGKPYLYIDECIAISLVEVKDAPSDTTYTAWNTTDWIACRGDPRSPDFNSLPKDLLMVDPSGDESYFTQGTITTRGGYPTQDVAHGTPTVRVTATWGFSATAPVDIKEAALMQAARWFKRFQSAMADVLASGELGTLLFRLSLDPDIRRILVDGRYVRPTIGRR